MLEILIALNVSLMPPSPSGSVFKTTYSQVSSTNTPNDSTPSGDSDTAPTRGSGRRE